MVDNPMQPRGQLGPTSRSRTSSRWTLGVLVLTVCHLVFFLPFRAWVPVPPEVDPWWAMGLVLADGAAFMVLIRMGIRKVTGTSAQETEE